MQHERALEAARQRRVELKEAVSIVEIAASSPIGGPNWRSNLQTELERLRIALRQHVEEVEGAEGLLAQLTDDAPRLVNKIGQVRDEHVELTLQVADAIARAKQPSGAEELRSEVLAVLVSIVCHRQRGADLVYEAYEVDIGGG
jgi:septal ring factor EnvC (AmiA/AmiB activator)